MTLDYDQWLLSGSGGPYDDKDRVCHYCDGSGAVEHNLEKFPCHWCDGSGIEPEPEPPEDDD